MTTDNPHSGALVAGAATVTLAERYQYIDFYNLDTNPMYIRADGQAAVVGADGTYLVKANDHLMIANGLPMWYQGRVYPSVGLAESNPGTSISIVGTTTGNFSVIGR